MKNPNMQLGKLGEALARKYLEDEGYIIMAQNYSCRTGEVDLIGRIGDTLVFIEVKTRSTHTFGTPGEAVDYRKQTRLCNTALNYIQRYGYVDMDYRFDIIEVYAHKNYYLNHIKDAFQPGSYR